MTRLTDYLLDGVRVHDAWRQGHVEKEHVQDQGALDCWKSLVPCCSAKSEASLQGLSEAKVEKIKASNSTVFLLQARFPVGAPSKLTGLCVQQEAAAKILVSHILFSPSRLSS